MHTKENIFEYKTHDNISLVLKLVKNLVCVAMRRESFTILLDTVDAITPVSTPAVHTSRILVL